MFDWPARMKTFIGFASTPRVARSTDVRMAAVDFMVVDRVKSIRRVLARPCRDRPAAWREKGEGQI